MNLKLLFFCLILAVLLIPAELKRKKPKIHHRGHAHGSGHKQDKKVREKVEDIIKDPVFEILEGDGDDDDDDDDHRSSDWLFDLQEPEGQCNPNPCHNNGVCEEKGNRRFKCNCPKPFKGWKCEKGPKHCKRGRCGRGECVLISTPPFYECKCKEPFQPPRCINMSLCEPNPCRNGGQCIKDGNNFECECPPGFSGRFCHVGPGDCYDDDGKSYRGNVSETDDGYDCLYWNSHFILNSGVDPFNSFNNSNGLGPHNFCRNPDGDGMPWCFFRKGSKLSWDYCDVTECPEPTGVAPTEIVPAVTEPTSPKPQPAKPEPTAPSKPTKPRAPSEPTEPTASSEPIKPTAFSEPTETTASSEPTETTASSEPTETTASSEPTEPTASPETTEPTASSEPTEPTASSEPTEPTASSETTEPTASSEPTEPTASSETTEPTASSETTEPTASSEPIKPTAFSEPTEPTTTEKPSQAPQPSPTPTDDVPLTPTAPPQQFTTCGKPKPQNSITRIFGGLKVPPGAVPWQVSLQVRSWGSNQPFRHICGGVLIASCWVLTARHCILEMEKQVVVGGLSLNMMEPTEQTLQVEGAIMHEDYRATPAAVYNDIALLRLKGTDGVCANETESVKAACLPDAQLPDGMECKISGWGATEDSQFGSNHLLEANVLLINQEKCSEPQIYGNVLDNSMFCAGHLQGGVDSCQGDSGGPLTCEQNSTSVIYGLVSWGDQCARENKPGVYTRVTHFLDWIKSNMQAF